MRRNSFCGLFCFALVLIAGVANANLIPANPANYTSYLASLTAGDTLSLAAGVYTNNLSLSGLNGSAVQPIVITGNGNATTFHGQSCCNTVSITQCSFLVIEHFQLDGMNLAIDAVKGEGTANNWAHHITVQYLNIINYGSDQQNVGISTKCSAWNWIIRKNTIVGAGTGMYLGNSDGTDPFVNGLIEYNYVANTVGYNIEIKHQLDTVRDNFPGTSVNGKTTIRHNVFTKDATSSTGANARPNLLVGGFPSTGFGSTDYNEIYGNFFYNNPVEALFQGTGNIILYENIFVNHFDPSGFRAVYLTPQNGINPQDIKVFHNTVWAMNTSGGIRLLSPNTSYQQYSYANAVFAPSAITGFTNSLNNITDTYSNAATYVLSASANIALLDLYPASGQLTTAFTPSTLFQNYTDWNLDFNNDLYNWNYVGAYSACCANGGWQLQLDTMSGQTTITGISALTNESDFLIYPEPFSNRLTIQNRNSFSWKINIYDAIGKEVFSSQLNSGNQVFDFADEPNGIYVILFNDGRHFISRKVIKE